MLAGLVYPVGFAVVPGWLTGSPQLVGRLVSFALAAWPHVGFRMGSGLVAVLSLLVGLLGPVVCRLAPVCSPVGTAWLADFPRLVAKVPPLGWQVGSGWLACWSLWVGPLVPVGWPVGPGCLAGWSRLDGRLLPLAWPVGSRWLAGWPGLLAGWPRLAGR